MQKSFTVELELGNEAMESANDIATALRAIADQVEQHNSQVLRPMHSRSVMDSNGNTIGSWNIQEDYS